MLIAKPHQLAKSSAYAGMYIRNSLSVHVELLVSSGIHHPTLQHKPISANFENID